MTTSDTRERAEVRRALDLLKPHLKAFLGQLTLPAGITSVGGPDIQVLLNQIIRDWDLLYRNKLPSVVRSYLHELRDFRNRWAHEEPLSAEDSARAVDTVNRVAKAIGAPYPLVTEAIQERQHYPRATPPAADRKAPVERSPSGPIETPIETIHEKKERSMKHHWTEKDDVVVLYLYKFGIDLLPYPMERIAEQRGMTLASLKMRIGNMRAVAGGGGLGHYGKITKTVYDRYRSKPEAELRSLAFPELAGKD